MRLVSPVSIVAVAAALLVLSLSPFARACGVSGAGALGVSGCSLAEHREETRKKWHVGAGYAYTSTAIRFSEEVRAGEQRYTALVTADYSPTRRVTLELGAGSLLAGSLRVAGVPHEFSPGPLGLVGASWRLLEPDGSRPFVLLTGQVAFVAASTREQGSSAFPSVGYQAFDLRLGGIAGTTLFRVLSPYVLARAFGGPVFWRDQGEA